MNVFKLDESERVARQILSEHVESDLGHWESCMRLYRQKKSALVAALDAQTGRRIVSVSCEPTDGQKSQSWINSLRVALALAKDAAGTAEVDYVANPSERTAKSMEAKRAQVKRIQDAQPSLDIFTSYAPISWFISARVTDDTFPLADAPKFRKGQSLSRALAAYLRYRGMSADDAALIVEAVVSAAQAKPRSGFLVLSANVLDIIMMSEHASFTSCHGLDGCHCAGPQQYLYDPHTIVCYYWEDERKYAGHSLPFKLFRQLAYVDAGAGAAALQRTYGQVLPDSFHVDLRREVARLLLRLADRDDSNPTWKLGTNRDGAAVRTGAGLAYLDGTESYLSLEGTRPTIRLAKEVPCAGCGEDLAEHGKLVCDDCFDPAIAQCEHCEGSIYCDDEIFTVNGEGTYCGQCYRRCYFLCRCCENDCELDEGVQVGSWLLCEDCADEHYPACANCGERTPEDDVADGYCPDCNPYRPCERCGHEVHEDLLDCDSLPGIEGDGLCPDCLPHYEHLLNLALRFLRSPRYVRLCVADALYGTDDSAALRWSFATRVGFDRFCFLLHSAITYSGVRS